MSEEIWRRDEIESPCVKICVIHPRAKICAGCFRTGEEIAAWSRLTPLGNARKATLWFLTCPKKFLKMSWQLRSPVLEIPF